MDANGMLKVTHMVALGATHHHGGGATTQFGAGVSQLPSATLHTQGMVDSAKGVVQFLMLPLTDDDEGGGGGGDAAAA